MEFGYAHFGEMFRHAKSEDSIPKETIIVELEGRRFLTKVFEFNFPKYGEVILWYGSVIDSE